MNSIAKPKVMGTMIASSRTLMSTLIYNRKKKTGKKHWENYSKMQREQRHSIFLPKTIMSKGCIYVTSIL